MFSDDDYKIWRRQEILRQQMREAGFSTRTINSLGYSLPFESVVELRSSRWEDIGEDRDQRGLRWLLSVTSGCGPQVVAEVEAYRAGLDPRQARAPGPTRISAAFSDDELAALDAWRDADASGLSRGDAVKVLAFRALKPSGR